MVVMSCYIINKAGGLVFHRTFNDGLSQLSANDYLVIAGTFHGVHAIASQISPVGRSSGIQTLESNRFKIHCFQTLTGTKFLLTTDLYHPLAEIALRRVYELYADYVMKNPFYQAEMPVRCAAFDTQLDKYLKAL